MTTTIIGADIMILVIFALNIFLYIFSVRKVNLSPELNVVGTSRLITIGIVPSTVISMVTSTRTLFIQTAYSTPGYNIKLVAFIAAIMFSMYTITLTWKNLFSFIRKEILCDKTGDTVLLAMQFIVITSTGIVLILNLSAALSLMLKVNLFGFATPLLITIMVWAAISFIITVSEEVKPHMEVESELV